MDGIEKLWSDLAALDEAETAKRLGIRFDADGYVVPFLDCAYRVLPGSRSIEKIVDKRPGEDRISHDLELCLLSFLAFGEIRQREVAWITEKELPGGSVFFQGPHAMPIRPLTDTYGRNVEAFVLRGVSLGGTQSEYGDGSVELAVLPGIRICFAIWEADDEFDASCTVMFDGSFKGMFPLDIVLAMTSAVVSRIVGY